MFRGSYAAFGVVLGSIKLLYSKWIRRRLLKVLKTQVCKSFYHRVHRVATAAFWRTFSNEGKISPGW